MATTNAHLFACARLRGPPVVRSVNLASNAGARPSELPSDRLQHGQRDVQPPVAARGIIEAAAGPGPLTHGYSEDRWAEVPDLTNVTTLEQVSQVVTDVYPGSDSLVEQDDHVHDGQRNRNRDRDPHAGGTGPSAPRQQW